MQKSCVKCARWWWWILWKWSVGRRRSAFRTGRQKRPAWGTSCSRALQTASVSCRLSWCWRRSCCSSDTNWRRCVWACRGEFSCGHCQKKAEDGTTASSAETSVSAASAETNYSFGKWKKVELICNFTHWFGRNKDCRLDRAQFGCCLWKQVSTPSFLERGIARGGGWRGQPLLGSVNNKKRFRKDEIYRIKNCFNSPNNGSKRLEIGTRMRPECQSPGLPSQNQEFSWTWQALEDPRSQITDAFHLAPHSATKNQKCYIKMSNLNCFVCKKIDKTKVFLQLTSSELG